VKVHPCATVLALLAVGLLTTACGSSQSGGSSPKATPTLQTVAKVVPAMQAAVKGATSVNMVGAVQDGSKQLFIDINFQDGGGSGTVSEASPSRSGTPCRR
jgi:hypothetical protein